MKATILLLAGIVLAMLPDASAQTTFVRVEDALDHASAKSVTAQANALKMMQAKKARTAALVAIVDPTASASMALINNLNLPVNLFPAEFVGGEPGTFRQVQTGVQYNTIVASNVDVKLFNLPGLRGLKLANTNLAVTETDNQLALKSLLQNVADAYFNVVQWQAQAIAHQRNVLAADSILLIATNKFNQGQVAQQQVNDSRINTLQARQSLQHAEYSLEQSLLDLKLLCDLPEETELNVSQSYNAPLIEQELEVATNLLRAENAQLRKEYALADMRKVGAGFFVPTLSLMYSTNYNQYNQEQTIAGGNWIHNNYVGLKLGFTVPTATSVANRTKARYDFEIASKNEQHAQLQATVERNLLIIANKKALAQYITQKHVYELQADTYAHNKRLYQQGLADMHQLLTSYTSMVNSEADALSVLADVGVAEANININNRLNSSRYEK